MDICAHRLRKFRNVILPGLTLLFMAIFIATANIPTRASGSRSNQNLTEEIEGLLSERGYWITKVDRRRDSSTYHAIVAFQKQNGMKKDGRIRRSLIPKIEETVTPKPFYLGLRHVEINLKTQVLFYVNEADEVTHILPVSTGNGKPYRLNGMRQIARTPKGIFRIYRQIKGVRRAPLGVLYHPSYFLGGIAIHGSNSIPFYPASHGCVRIPRFAAKDFSDLVEIGVPVVIHDGTKDNQRLDVILGEKKRH